MSQKEKVAIVTVRYGLNIQGGEETRARYYAEFLKEKYDVDVITTQSSSIVDWANDIKKDREEINGVNVLRFPNDHKQQEYSIHLDPSTALYAGNSLSNSEEFLKKFGPYSTKLIEYLEKHKDEYKYFIYMPYLYPTTYWGTKTTPKEKNILAPAAHDEDFLRFPYMAEVMKNVSKIIFNAQEEKNLVFHYYGGIYDTKIVAAPIYAQPSDIDVKKNFNLNNDYILYAGRIDEGKGVDKLIKYFQNYKKLNKKSNLDLVLIGKNIIPIPKQKDIKYLGFVSEEEKYALMQNAFVFCLPSALESFSIVVLESMKLGVPVIVNGKADVVAGHCKKSNAGLWYNNEREFYYIIDWYLKHPEERKLMGENGKKYAEANYSPESVQKRLLEIVK